MTAVLWRRLVAEFTGTALLVAVVVGSGIAAARLSPSDVGLQLLENSTVTAFGLAALILTFGPVSGAHFNPVVTVVDWFLARRRGTALPVTDVLAYALTQTAGAIAGAVLADGMFDVALVRWSTHDRSDGHLLVGEVVATAGLVLLIFSLARSGKANLSAPAVGAYIGAAYWFTSSTSFANPAVTVGRAFTDTFAGIQPASVSGFVIAQIAGAAVGTALLLALYPHAEIGAEQAVVPHSGTGRTPVIQAAPTADGRPSVLFVCVHNAGRSQMAAGWLRHLAGDRVEVRSAGSAPAETINPVAIEAMGEVGIDITDAQPKILTGEAVQASDVVITMGCGDACPIFPGTRYEDWDLEDPAGQPIETVRRVRDEIRTRVEELLGDLRVPTRVPANRPRTT